jgi:exopolysaccharide production protein ExoQ
MVLIIFMLVSILWSPIPDTSFVRWIREIQAVLMAFVVLSERSPRRAIESILRRTTYVLIPFSLILIRFFPGYGRVYNRWSGDVQWIGVTLQKNGLGRLCLISVIFLLWSLVRRRQGHNDPVWKFQTLTEIFLLGIAFWLLKGPGIGGYSATALASLAMGLLVYAGLRIAKKRGIIVSAGALQVVVALIILFGIVTIFTSGTILGSMAPSIGRNSTLTDRTAIWQAVLPAAMQHPWLGHGFGSFWTLKNKEFYTVGEAHSGYLDELLDLGFMGLLLVSLFYLSSCRKACRMLSADFDWGALWICYLIAAVVHNITESSINTFTTQLPATILILAVACSSDSPGPDDSPSGPSSSNETFET